MASEGREDRLQLLSFPGLPEIAPVPYQKTRDRVAEVEGMPAQPAFAGAPAGEWGQFTLLPNNDDLNSDDPPDNFLSPLQFSWRQSRWNDDDRWAAQNNRFSSLASLTNGISHIALGTLQPLVIGQNLEILSLIPTTDGSEAGQVMALTWQVQGISRKPGWQLLTGSVIEFRLDNAVLDLSDLEQNRPLEYGNYDDGPWPNRIAIEGLVEAADGTPGTPDTPATPDTLARRTRGVTMTYFEGNTISTSGDDPDQAGEWSLRIEGTLQRAADSIRTIPAGSIFKLYTPGLELPSLKRTERIYRYSIILDWYRFKLENPYRIDGTASIQGPNRRGMDVDVDIASDVTTLTMIDPGSRLFSNPPNLTWDNIRDQDQRIELQLRLSAFIEFFETIPGSPMIPGTPGTPGTPAPPSPAIPSFGGTPAVEAVEGIGAQFGGARYGRPAIPPVQIYARRVARRIDTAQTGESTEFALVDFDVGNGDYWVRQSWECDTTHTIKNGLWLRDEDGLNQRIIGLAFINLEVIRFDTLAYVNGPGNAEAPPLPMDIMEDDDVQTPNFPIRPELLNSESHDQVAAALIGEALMAEATWAEDGNTDLIPTAKIPARQWLLSVPNPANNAAIIAALDAQLVDDKDGDLAIVYSNQAVYGCLHVAGAWQIRYTIPRTMLPNFQQAEPSVLFSRAGNLYWEEINQVPDTPGEQSGIGHVLTVTGENDRDYAFRALPALVDQNARDAAAAANQAAQDAAAAATNPVDQNARNGAVMARQTAIAAQLAADTVIEASPAFHVGFVGQQNLYLSIRHPANAYRDANIIQVSVQGVANVILGYRPGEIQAEYTIGITAAQMNNIATNGHLVEGNFILVDVRLRNGRNGPVIFQRNVYVPVEKALPPKPVDIAPSGANNRSLVLPANYLDYDVVYMNIRDNQYIELSLIVSDLTDGGVHRSGGQANATWNQARRTFTLNRGAFVAGHLRG